MRRLSAILLFLVLVALVAGTAGCGSASTANLSAAGQDPTPETILAGAMTASDTLTSATGSFDVSLSIDTDTTQTSQQQKAVLTGPIQVTGTFASQKEPLAAEATVSLSMSGQTMDVGVKALKDKAWLCLQNQWYEAPSELTDMMAQDSQSKAKTEQIRQLVSALGVDPMTWVKDLTLAGQETVDGAAVYHLTGSPDVAKMVTDLVGLMQSDEFMKLIDPGGTMSGTSGVGSMIPSPDELAQMQNELATMFQNFKIDLWIDKATSLMRKAVVAAHITPPAGQDTGGVNAVDFTLTVSLQNHNQPVTVEAPASPLPYSELEKAMQEHPEEFMGPFAGMLQEMQTN